MRIFFRPSWRRGTKCDWKTDWLWVRFPLEEMKYLLKFIFPFLRSGAEARRWVLPLNTQCLQNSAESGERSVLTLGSLCLPCCMRDTAGSWFFLVFLTVASTDSDKRCYYRTSTDPIGFSFYVYSLSWRETSDGKGEKRNGPLFTAPRRWQIARDSSLTTCCRRHRFPCCCFYYVYLLLWPGYNLKW